MNGKDYYKILDVPEDASEDVIKKAYRQLAKKYHPDVNKGNPQAEAKFKDVSEAYGVLSDKTKRAQYDQIRKYGGNPFAGGGNPFGGGGFGGQGFPGGFGQGGININDLGLGSLGDIFSSLFGDVGMRTHQKKYQHSRPNKGADLRMTLPVSFAESLNGAEKTIRLNRQEKCSTCGGTGAEPGSGKTVCPECNGSGMVSMSQGMFAISRPCPRCMGTGQIIGKPCHSCNASGIVTAKKTIKVKIPAGIESGKKIRLKGMGNAGQNGAPYGDLIITVTVKADNFLRRQGSDIFCTLPISIKQAVEGVTVKVRTLDGQAQLKIPPMTQDGALFKLKKQGIKSGRKRGDQFVRIKIKIPEKPSEEEQELIDKLKAETEPAGK